VDKLFLQTSSIITVVIRAFLDRFSDITFIDFIRADGQDATETFWLNTV
jgi:hypothetical protein